MEKRNHQITVLDKKYWAHVLLKSTLTFHLIASQVSLVLVCIVQNLHFWSCNIGIWNHSWGRGDGTANVKEPTKIVSAYTATVAEEMIMELYRHHTFLYSSLQEIIIWWRTSVRYWPVVFQCFFAKSYTLGNWRSLERLGYKVTTKNMKEEGEKLLPVGGESVTQINHVMEKVNSEKKYT